MYRPVHKLWLGSGKSGEMESLCQFCLGLRVLDLDTHCLLLLFEWLLFLNWITAVTHANQTMSILSMLEQNRNNSSIVSNELFLTNDTFVNCIYPFVEQRVRPKTLFSKYFDWYRLSRIELLWVALYSLQLYDLIILAVGVPLTLILLAVRVPLPLIILAVRVLLTFYSGLDRGFEWPMWLGYLPSSRRCANCWGGTGQEKAPSRSQLARWFHL